MIRLVLSAFGSLWLLSGLLSIHVCTTVPRDPNKPPEQLDAAGWVMFVWNAIWLVMFGPISLSAAIGYRDKRRKELREAAEKGPFIW